MLMFHRSDLENAHAYLAESLAISQEINYDKGAADALIGLGRIANRQSYDQSSALHNQERALSLYRALGDVDHIAYALVLLAQTCMYQGDFLQARALCEESFAVARRVGYYYAWPMYQLGFVCSRAGDLDEAQSLHRQALPVLREQRNMGLLAYTLTDLGSIAIRKGELIMARRYLEEVLAIHKNLGSIRTADIMVPWAELHWAEGDHSRAIQLYRASLATMIDDRGSSQSQFLLGLATLANMLGHCEVTARLLGTSNTLDEAAQPLWPIERGDFNRLFEATRVCLELERFDAAWNEGRTLTFEQTAEDAVSILEAALHIPKHSLPD
jgi:tetratricopeptide (TPR) repeat protein